MNFNILKSYNDLTGIINKKRIGRLKDLLQEDLLCNKEKVIRKMKRKTKTKKDSLNLGENGCLF